MTSTTITTAPTLTPEERVLAQAARYGDPEGTLGASAVLALHIRQARPGAACGRCGERKPISAYGVDTSNAAARATTCKECLTASRVLATSPEWAAERVELAQHGERRCSRCRRVSALEGFALKAKGPDGRARACRACQSASNATYRRTAAQ